MQSNVGQFKGWRWSVLRNNMLMQFQADILGAEVERPKLESTAMGAAYLAGIQAGLWKKNDIVKNRVIDKKFSPGMESVTREKLYRGWKKAVQRTMKWIDLNLRTVEPKPGTLNLELKPGNFGWIRKLLECARSE